MSRGQVGRWDGDRAQLGRGGGMSDIRRMRLQLGPGEKAGEGRVRIAQRDVLSGG